MLKREIEQCINKQNNKIFNFGPLRDCLNNLPDLNYKIVPFNTEKIKGYERVDIKYKNSSISVEFKASSPNIELVFVKKYNEKNIIQEEITFIHILDENKFEYTNGIIHFKLEEYDNNVDILHTQYYYLNNKPINKETDKISMTKENFYRYIDQSIIPLRSEDMDSCYTFTNEELLELEQKTALLSRVCGYACNEKKNIRHKK